MLTIAYRAESQSIAIAQELPEVADEEFSHLIFPGREDGFLAFYAKLNAVRNPYSSKVNNATAGVLYPYRVFPEANILHIGGSHVQAGELSNTIRMHFEPSGDRGLLFPFRAVKTNGSQHYRFDYTGMWKSVRNVVAHPEVELGLSGIAAITSDESASITLRLRDAGKWDFQQLYILGESSDPSVIPYIITQKGDTVWADTIMSHIADIDGIWAYQLAEPDSVVTLQMTGLNRTVGEKQQLKTYFPLQDEHYFVLRGFLPTSNRRGITYTEAGVNGASLESWARCTEHFDQELSLLPPDLAIFGIGINDAHVPVSDFNPEDFKMRYRTLVSRILEINPDCCFLWITNNDSAMRHGRGRRARYTPNKNGERVRQAMLELAEEYNGAVIDVFSLMGGLGSADKWIKAGFMQRDHIHFTRDGYQVIGHIIYNAIAEDYVKYYKDDM